MTSWLCPASRRIASSGISLGPAAGEGAALSKPAVSTGYRATVRSPWGLVGRDEGAWKGASMAPSSQAESVSCSGRGPCPCRQRAQWGRAISQACACTHHSMWHASRQRPAGGVGLTGCKEVLLLLLRRLLHLPNRDLQMGQHWFCSTCVACESSVQSSTPSARLSDRQPEGKRKKTAGSHLDLVNVLHKDFQTSWNLELLPMSKQIQHRTTAGPCLELINVLHKDVPRMQRRVFACSNEGVPRHKGNRCQVTCQRCVGMCCRALSLSRSTATCIARLTVHVCALLIQVCLQLHVLEALEDEEK